MRPAEGFTRAMWLPLLAVAGLLLGHFAAFVVVFPDEGTRSAVLEVTGHRGHGLFVPIAGAALLGAVVGLIANHLRRPATGAGERPKLLGLGAGLWVAQTAGFVLLEVTERVVSSHAASELLHEPAFLVGLVIQALTAVVGALLVLLVSAAVVAIHRALRRPEHHESGSFPSAPEIAAKIRSLARLAWNLRGPPLPR